MSTRKLPKTWIVLCFAAAVPGIASTHGSAPPVVSATELVPTTRFGSHSLAGWRRVGVRAACIPPVFRDMNTMAGSRHHDRDLISESRRARPRGDGQPRFAVDEPLLGQDAKPLDFKNW
jgi:hypothetical protein